jgi:hypothetical protein
MQRVIGFGQHDQVSICIQMWTVASKLKADVDSPEGICRRRMDRNIANTYGGAYEQLRQHGPLMRHGYRLAYRSCGAQNPAAQAVHKCGGFGTGTPGGGFRGRPLPAAVPGGLIQKIMPTRPTTKRIASVCTRQNGSLGQSHSCPLLIRFHR